MPTVSDQLALLIERGGYIMVPLLGLSVISIALIVERSWFWLVTHRPGRLQTLGQVNDGLRRGRFDVVRALIQADRSPYGCVARGLIEHGTSDAVAMETIEAQRPRLDRFMVTLSTIITAAPLLGILGTVVGIIQSFRLLGEQSTLTDPAEVAGGIAAALLTTALGLIVALTTLFPYMIFRSQMERSLGRLESVIAAAQQGGQEAKQAAGEESAPAPPLDRARPTSADSAKVRTPAATAKGA
ncbi:MAG: MotA/TolQ/ExbB proton channel family protein [Planctomycetes bacterium]|nr:MotA/TolQ/ExbB proton channel family protein [Planctomycetota bacterium]